MNAADTLEALASNGCVVTTIGMQNAFIVESPVVAAIAALR